MLSERLDHKAAANELLDAADEVECIDAAGDIAGLPGHLVRLGDALRAMGRAYGIPRRPGRARRRRHTSGSRRQ